MCPCAVVTYPGIPAIVIHRQCCVRKGRWELVEICFYRSYASCDLSNIATLQLQTQKNFDYMVIGRSLRGNRKRERDTHIEGYLVGGYWMVDDRLIETTMLQFVHAVTYKYWNYFCSSLMLDILVGIMNEKQWINTWRWPSQKSYDTEKNLFNSKDKITSIHYLMFWTAKTPGWTERWLT